MTTTSTSGRAGRLEGKVAIVTGAARGMGEADARRLVAEGAHVVVADVLDDEGRQVADALGDAAVYVHLDVADETSWEHAMSVAHQRFGPVDVLVNNAGILAQGPVDQTDPATFRHVLDVNLTGVFLGIRAVVPDMRERGGSIVNISSAAGLVGMQGLGAYASSKWGVRGLTKCAALDLGRHGIRVNSIHPGAIRTPMAAGVTDADLAHQALPRVGEPDEIAAVVAFLASDDSSDMTGAELAVDGGMVLGATA